MPSNRNVPNSVKAAAIIGRLGYSIIQFCVGSVFLVCGLVAAFYFFVASVEPNVRAELAFFRWAFVASCVGFVYYKLERHYNED